MGCAPAHSGWNWPEDTTWNTVDDSVCHTGTEQSPIDLPVCSHGITDSANPIVPTDWGTATEIVYSHGMKINMPVPNTFKTSMRGLMYTLAQCHLHWGSEHTFGGVQDPLCM